jgi:short-subunit dehydrogenase
MHLLITGTSGAIGAALARALKQRHPAARFSLVDVAPAPSQALAAELGEARVVASDLQRPDDAARALDEARASFGDVDGLVNCAGFMEVRSFERLPWQRAEALLMVDLVSPLRLMHACVPPMLERGGGFIVNVASMAGKVTLAGCAFYCAAKSGLAMASEVARHELRNKNVKIVTVYPGAVRSALERSARAQYGNGLISRLVPTGEPEVLAAKIVDALDAGRARVIYPALYSVGLSSLAGPVALAIGPSAQD